MSTGEYVPDSWEKYQLKTKQIVAIAFMFMAVLALAMFTITEFLCVLHGSYFNHQIINYYQVKP